jgi:hypothetical protein
VLILLDQDGVLADFDEGFRRAWRARHPDHPPSSVSVRPNVPQARSHRKASAFVR